MPDRDQEMLWVLLAQTGDHKAFDCLLRSVQKPLHSYILSLVRRHDLAEDILQEVFLRIYRKLPWLRQAEFFRSWAYRIASRESLKHLQRERVRSDRMRGQDEMKEIAVQEDPESGRQELIQSMHANLDMVTPISREVMILHYMHYMSLREVADILGVSIGTVKSRLAYGLSTMRNHTSKDVVK